MNWFIAFTLIGMSFAAPLFFRKWILRLKLRELFMAALGVSFLLWFLNRERTVLEE
ncbi:hypothetical protein HYY75_13125 [bacterium]|nr:hypothetical protein [bacterium]